MNVGPLQHTSYTPFLDQVFDLRLDDGTSVPLTLASVRPYLDDEWQRSFSLHFSGPGDPLPQRMYRLRHDVLGEFDLFLVPIQKTTTGILYEAAFNLLKERAQ